MNELVAHGIAELSGAELDLVTGGGGLSLNLSNLVNINLAVPTQIANNIAVLTSNVSQWIIQGVSLHQ
ncbi:MAG: hypothetical protein U1E70_24735 [Acetobacteraceae bacterium]|nr:hypothetical protein [Pseudomonadota bacterium]